MNVTIIYGQNHKGSTWHIANMLAEKLGGNVKEFYLPRQFDRFCTGCTLCFTEDEKKCPSYKELEPFTRAMDEADVIILASPVYVYHATGAMKNFLDHYGYRWMVHRPEEKMFQKQGVCITTAAGSGTKSANRDMADSLFFWGVGKIYQYGQNVAATSFQEIADEKKKKIEADMERLAKKILQNQGRVRVGLKTKVFFCIVRKLQKEGWNQADMDYWKKKGWDRDRRPWK